MENEQSCGDCGEPSRNFERPAPSAERTRMDVAGASDEISRPSSSRPVAAVRKDRPAQAGTFPGHCPLMPTREGCESRCKRPPGGHSVRRHEGKSRGNREGDSVTRSIVPGPMIYEARIPRTRTRPDCARFAPDLAQQASSRPPRQGNHTVTRQVKRNPKNPLVSSPDFPSIGREKSRILTFKRRPSTWLDKGNHGCAHTQFPVMPAAWR
jgi:hypothetical protein